MSNLYQYGPDLVALLQDNGNKALIKILKSNRFKSGALFDVSWNDLRKTPQKKVVPSFEDPCPTCGTGGHLSGIECPGCGFKEWLAQI